MHTAPQAIWHTVTFIYLAMTFQRLAKFNTCTCPKIVKLQKFEQNGLQLALKVTDSFQQTAYNFLLVFHDNYVAFLVCFWCVA